MKVPSRLGPWELVEKIGSGAFSEVYSCRVAAGERMPSDVSASDEWVVKVCEKHKKKSSKSRNKQMPASYLLYSEYLLYRHLKDRKLLSHNTPRVPSTVSWNYQEDADGFSFLAMERLGKTLEEVVQGCGGSVTPATAANIGAQILQGMKEIHTFGYILRDVKPENFMIGRGPKANTVFFVDLGAASKRSEAEKPPAGTPTFMSRAAHLPSSPSPCDDLESLAYMLLWMASGTLPWLSATSEDEIRDRKIEFDPVQACKGIHPAAAQKVFTTFLQKILALGRSEVVDYDSLADLFLSFLGEKNGIEGLLQRTLIAPGPKASTSTSKLSTTSSKKDKGTSKATKTNKQPARRRGVKVIEVVDEDEEEDEKVEGEGQDSESFIATTETSNRPRTRRSARLTSATKENNRAAKTTRRTTRKSAKVMKKEEEEIVDDEAAQDLEDEGMQSADDGEKKPEEEEKRPKEEKSSRKRTRPREEEKHVEEAAEAKSSSKSAAQDKVEMVQEDVTETRVTTRSQRQKRARMDENTFHLVSTAFMIGASVYAATWSILEGFGVGAAGAQTT